MCAAHFVLFAQEEGKRELRSAWVATVANIDWPRYEHRNNPDAQKADLIRMLDLFSAMHMNSIFLQVRPECDALYQSAFEPWSRFLTWTQGDDPGYDPLGFALEEAHKRGIELHVWLNPYRINASSSDGGNYYDPSHVYIKHPEWAIAYSSGRKILNPGKPEVISYIGSIVRDIVTHYSVDGVHFDDYFYAYEGTPAALDATEYEEFGGGMSLGDWRRDNVNRMVDTVYSVIQDVNPSIRFGVSPFGIYRDGVPDGIIGFDAYNGIYCDPLAWLRNRSVDYLTPQLYWPTGGAQDFETLVNWWADSLYHYDRHLYPGQGSYRLSADPGLKKGILPDDCLHESKSYMDLYLSQMEVQALKGTGDPVAPWTLGEIGNQIDFIRSNLAKNGLGSVFFSAKDFSRVEGLAEYLMDHKYTHPTLMPEMTWKADDTPDSLQNIRFGIIDSAFYLLWDPGPISGERVAVYVSDAVTDPDSIISEPRNLQMVTFQQMIPLSDLVFSTGSRIALTTISSTGRESVPTASLELALDMPMAELTYPENGDTLIRKDSLRWVADLTNPRFQVQIATSAMFNNIIYTSPWINRFDFPLDTLGLDGEMPYFWRVRAKDTIYGPFSEARQFITGYPAEPLYLSPENLAQNVSTKPTIRWLSSPLTNEVEVEISKNSEFNPKDAESSFQASGGVGTLTSELEKETWYYIRIRGTNKFGSSAYSTFATFKTTAGEIPDAVLLSPEDLATAASFDRLQWETTATGGSVTFQLEVSLDDAFSNLLFRSGWTSLEELQIEGLNLEGKRSYFWRVKAKNEFGEGEYSAPRIFTAGYPTRPKISEPAHLSEGVEANPVIGWIADEDSDSILVECSEQSDFGTIAHAEKFVASTGSARISASLKGFTWYYCQVRAENEFGSSLYSAKKYFMTGEGTAVDPAWMVQDNLQVYPVLLSGGELHIRGRFQVRDRMALVIINQEGREIYQDVIRTRPDDLTIDEEVEFERFPGPGIYFVRISSKTINEVRVIIVN